MARWCSLLIMIVLLFILVIDNAAAIPNRDGKAVTGDDTNVLDHYPSKKPTTADDYFDLGVEYTAMNMLPEAAEQFRKALELDPKHVYSLISLANTVLQLGDMESAQKHCIMAMEIKPNDPMVHNAVGGVWMSNAISPEHIAEAEARFKKAISLDSRFVPAHANLAKLYMATSKIEEAIREFETAISIEPKNPELRHGFAYLYLNTGSIDKGLEQAQKMVELSPESPVYRNGLGEIYMNERQFEEALKEFRQAIKLDPKHALAYSNIGKIYLVQGLLDQAIEEFKKSLSHRSDYGEPYAGLGDAYVLKEMNQEAMLEYKRAIGENAIRTLSIPTFVSVHNNLAHIYSEDTEDLDMALSYAQKAIQVAPKHPAVADTLGWIYYKKGDFDAALSNLRIAVDGLPENPIVRYHLGAVLYKKGITDQASAELKKSLSMSSGEFPGIDQARRLLAELEGR